MKITTKIRKQYPTPITYNQSLSFAYYGKACYCVGGAVMLYMDQQDGLETADPFPTTFTLAYALEGYNPHLALCDAQDFASRITTANDKGHFRKAWQAAEEALTYTREETV